MEWPAEVKALSNDQLLMFCQWSRCEGNVVPVLALLHMRDSTDQGRGSTLSPSHLPLSSH